MTDAPQVDDRRRFKALWKELLLARLLVALLAGVAALLCEGVACPGSQITVLLCLAVPSLVARRGWGLPPLLAAAFACAVGALIVAERHGLARTWDLSVSVAIFGCALGLAEGIHDGSLTAVLSGGLGTGTAGAIAGRFALYLREETSPSSLAFRASLVLAFVTLHLASGASPGLARRVLRLAGLGRMPEQSGRRRLRFSLRTLVIFLLLFTSVVGLAWNWGPWVCEERVSLNSPWVGGMLAALSPDRRKVILLSGRFIGLWETETGKRIAASAGIPEKHLIPTFRGGGSRIALQIPDTDPTQFLEWVPGSEGVSELPGEGQPRHGVPPQSATPHGRKLVLPPDGGAEIRRKDGETIASLDRQVWGFRWGALSPSGQLAVLGWRTEGILVARLGPPVSVCRIGTPEDKIILAEFGATDDQIIAVTNGGDVLFMRQTAPPPVVGRPLHEGVLGDGALRGGVCVERGKGPKGVGEAEGGCPSLAGNFWWSS